MERSLDLLHRRRSIRKYHDEQVSKEHIDAILRAAMAAPSARNKQSWHFIVIEDREMLNKLTEIHLYAQMLKEATLCIIVCGDKENPFWVQDCSAATQNILLAATGLGLGSVWLGVHPNSQRENEVASLCNIPEAYAPLCLIAIGHPAEDKPPIDRFDLAKIHIEKW
ncbi:MAG: nitroreductase family protein [bacterium]|nr:nitroreductase family protein [bacterium]